VMEIVLMMVQIKVTGSGLHFFVLHNNSYFYNFCSDFQPSIYCMRDASNITDASGLILVHFFCRGPPLAKTKHNVTVFYGICDNFD